MTQKVGVAGCGRMGESMLAALLRHNFTAQGFDVKKKTARHITTDAKAFAQDLHTLITVVRDIDQTNDVLFGTQSLAQCPTLKRIIISSTLSPRYVKDLRARVPNHVTLIDAPMSGAQIAAQEARLSFMLGGTTQDLDAAQPLFNAMGRYFHHMGPFGSGMQAKVLNNLLAASNTAMTRLVLDWARNTDLDPQGLLDLIQTSSGQNWFASGFQDIEFAQDGFDPDNTIGILVKDVASALDAAPDTADLTLPKTVQDTIKSLTPFHLSK